MLLASILSADEYKSIPSNVATKINEAFNSKIEESLTGKALLETYKRNHGLYIFYNKQKILLHVIPIRIHVKRTIRYRGSNRTDSEKFIARNRKKRKYCFRVR